MFGFQIADIFVKSPATAVEYGFLAWGFLVLSIGIIFLAMTAVKALSKKKKDSDT